MDDNWQEADDDDDAIGKAQCLEPSLGFMRLEQSPGRNKLFTAEIPKGNLVETGRGAKYLFGRRV